MKKYIATVLLFGFVFAANVAEARKLEGERKTGKRGSGTTGVAANCSPPTSATELDINNVRALIQTGGDMWWDLVGQPQYEVPQGSGRTALFAGSLWLGGQDISGQIKVAAQRFRSQGNDFWTGPLSTVDAEISPQTCIEWDKHFQTTRNDVSEFVAWYRCGLDPECNQAETFPNYQVPSSILDWPAHGRNFAPFNEDYYLAPFEDVDGDGNYDPSAGDYPRYDLEGNTDCQQRIVDIYGDQNLWWIFNDKGNIHTESQAEAIGMEIRAQAFSFATNDEVNNMTFYNYELVNRSSFQLTDTYFGFWVDADLGNAQDDFVGCDVERGLGYCFNGDENDEDQGGAIGYGDDPPAIGVDFFQGPFQDNDSKDNCLCLDDYQGAIADDGIPYRGLGVGYGDGIVDNERLGMRAFLYHNNDNTNTGDPRTGVEYYNFLRSFWRDNSHMVYGGTGFRGSVSPPYIEADFMFPGTSDPVGWGTDGQVQPEWTEVTAGNAPNDRRFVQSSGPFILAPGAVNNITVGVVWSRAATGGRLESVNKLLVDDQKTQALFDNCFQLLDGPDAPEVQIVELDKELILQISNLPTSNNFNESYEEIDPFIVAPDSLPDASGNLYGSESQDLDSLRIYEELARVYRSYRFQGYQIFQLKDQSVSAADLFDNTLARLVSQSDVKDEITDMINYRFDDRFNTNFPEPRVENAPNEGVRKSLQITTDLFAEGDNALVNHKTYYYMVVAYAHNEFKEFDPLNPDALDGQQEPYLPSRKSATGAIRIFTAIPHKPQPSDGGTVLNAQYGDGVEITRIEGIGNGGRNIEFTQASIDAAMTGEPWIVTNPTYQRGAGPIEVTVVDPLSVKEGTYRLAFQDTTGNLNNAVWTISGGALAEPVTSASTVALGDEVLVPEIGISITIEDVPNTGEPGAFQNGVIASSIEFQDFNQAWLTGITDLDGNVFQNWIRSGTNAEQDFEEYWDYNYRNATGDLNGVGLDDDEFFESMAGGSWAPFRMSTWNIHGPAADRANAQFGSTGTNSLWTGLPLPDNNEGFMLGYLNSINVYLTNDQSKWTRCVVLEMQDDSSLAFGSAVKLDPRASASVDQFGNPADTSLSGSDNLSDPHYISSQGMGWFPGYAIDMETGERLNMAFGEDSYLRSENGRDMIWNPTSSLYEGVVQDANVRFGGKHYIFVFRNNSVEEGRYVIPSAFNEPGSRMPAYDGGQFMYEKLSSGRAQDYRDVFRSCSWVGAPMLVVGENLLATDVTIKLRVNKSFQHFSTGDYLNIGQTLQNGQEYLVHYGPVVYDGEEYVRGDVILGTGALLEESPGNTGNDTIDNVIATENGGRPLYEFSLNGLAPTLNVQTVAEDALDLIDVVPNPYYAYSQYETSKLDNRVRIINLPERCNIKIYTLNGVLVREFDKDDPSVASIDWDLKNHIRIPIASGIYIIHVDVPGVGERVLKWFGVMRPVDLDSF